MYEDFSTEQEEFREDNTLREKIALVVFVVVLAICAAVIIFYFGFSTSFNVVATKVDEKFGTMDFCYSIVYKGIGEEAAIGTISDASASSAKTTGSEDSENTETTSNSASDSSGDTESGDEDLNESKEKASVAEEEETLRQAFSSVLISGLSPVYVSDVRSDYLDKNSEVVTIDMQEIVDSGEPTVLKFGSKTLGIFSINNYYTKAAIQGVVSQLKADGADVIMCIAPRSNMFGTYEGIDAVLCTKEKSPSETSEGRVDNTFIFRSPNPACVGVISISDSNVFIQSVVFPTLPTSEDES
ncbi:MAG: hypothetical protein Q3982_00075 [Phoenicibacter congonensis]|uniref:Uncharacterized protein n=1 Tax=Phoenicibacter congonensis TaxID=1944646 RepID=A0AA43RG19_9ACTN|nr:hypothetical protein [Phoenicibacter congonensis]